MSDAENERPEDQLTPGKTPESGDAGEADSPSDSSGAAPAPSRPKGRPSEPEPEPLVAPGMQWYVLRVASNKEEYVREALERKVKIEGYDDVVGRILVPTLKERRMKAGVARVYKRNLYPGYVFVEMRTQEDGSVPENVWFMFKETTGVGDFIGSEGKPSSMPDHEIRDMLAAATQEEDTPTLAGLNFKKGDQVKISSGSFENFEGEVDQVDEKRGMVTVIVQIFGRSTPVEVEYWQLERV